MSVHSTRVGDEKGGLLAGGDKVLTDIAARFSRGERALLAL